MPTKIKWVIIGILIFIIIITVPSVFGDVFHALTDFFKGIAQSAKDIGPIELPPIQ